MSEVGVDTTDEDTPLTIALSASDIDGDDLSFTAESGNENVTVSLINNQLVLTPADNWNGSTNILVTVSDGVSNDTEIFELIVNAINDAPVLSEIGLNSTPEEVSLITTLSASDIDGDDLTFIAESYSANVSINVVGDQLTMTPDLDFNGTAQIKVTVTDGDLSDDEIFQLDVIAVNDAPFCLKLELIQLMKILH